MDDELRTAASPLQGSFSFAIPLELLLQFKQDVRVVIKYPGLIGIPIPDVLLNPELIRGVREFEPMLVPRQFIG